MKIVSAVPCPTEVISGENSEMADMSKPHGYLYKKIYLVQAETKNGRRFNHFHEFDSLQKAVAFAKKVQDKGEIQEETYWVETYPCYGSSAWEAEDIERSASLQIALANNDHEGIERYS